MLGLGLDFPKQRIVSSGVSFANDQSLDGTSGVEIDDITGYDGISPGSDWAFSCWFKIPPGDTNAFYFFAASTTGDNGQFRLDTSGAGSGNVILQRIYTLPGLTRDQVWLYASNAIIRDGNWHHIIAISNGYDYTNTDLEFYIDGVLRSTSLRNEATIADGPWSMTAGGTRITRPPNVFSAGSAIDEIAIWNSTTPVVADVYNSGCPGDLSVIANPPDHWFRYEGSIEDVGTLAETPTVTGTPTYLSDVVC
jgi:hypothetical protein